MEPRAGARRSPGEMSDLFAGTYAKPGGKGIYPLQLAPDGSLGLRECAAPALNSSFGVYSAARGLHYLVDECDSRVCAWRRHGKGWQKLADLPSSGEEPCYLALDREGRRLAVANYRSGSLALFALDGEGLPLAPPAAFQDSGTGPVEGRQDGPHLHCARFAPDGESLYAVDLGADHVLRFPLDGARLGEPVLAYKAPSGSGPRHLLFHPERPFALLISELAATLTLLAVEDGRLAPLATCPTAPADWRGDNLGGHLAWPSAERAYVTNRGHDSVALIEVDLDHATLMPLQHVASGGQSPRHFLLLNRQMVVAHEKDGTVASFSLDQQGRISSTGQAVHVPGACFVFAAGGGRG
jgi:6-phosphogluconolactonase